MKKIMGIIKKINFLFIFSITLILANKIQITAYQAFPSGGISYLKATPFVVINNTNYIYSSFSQQIQSYPTNFLNLTVNNEIANKLNSGQYPYNGWRIETTFKTSSEARIVKIYVNDVLKTTTNVFPDKYYSYAYNIPEKGSITITVMETTKFGVNRYLGVGHLFIN